MGTGLREERGGIVAGWLLKIVIVFAVVGVVAFDAIAITVARVTASDDAHTIGDAASEAVIVSHATPEKAREVALDRAQSRGIKLAEQDLVITADGAVTVRVRRQANTVLAQRIGPLQKYTQVVEVYHTTPETS